MFGSLINKALSFLSVDPTNANWLRTFSEQEIEEINDPRIRHLVRKQGIPNDLKRTIWPKLIKLHRIAKNEELTQQLHKRRHSRNLSTLLNNDVLEVFELSKSESNMVKSLLMGYRGEVHIIMQIILPFLVKFCAIDEIEDLTMRINTPSEQGGYFFYPKNNREILIFERVFEDLLHKFAPSNNETHYKHTADYPRVCTRMGAVAVWTRCRNLFVILGNPHI